MAFKLSKGNLGFRVITASDVPEVGNENIVVVVSDVPMTNWMLSPRAPEGSPRKDGDVWLQYSTANGNFNLLKSNALMVIIISAKQYVDGEWVEREFEVHQGGGQESNFSGILYLDGDKFDDLSFTYNSYLTITEKTDHLYVYLSANTQGIGYTVKSYDLTSYNKLVMKYESMSASTTCGVGVYKSRSQIKAAASSNTSGTVTLDISSLTGEHELGITMTANDGGKTMRVTYFALEK